MKTIYWLLAIAGVIAVLYYLNNNYNPLAEIIGDLKAPTGVDPKPGPPVREGGFRSQSPDAVGNTQSLPTQFRPWTATPGNPVQ